MMKITAAMPEDRFGFKSTPPQRNFGEQAMHVATSNLIGLGTLRARATAPAINRNATSKTDILKALSASFDYGIAVINEQTDRSLMETIEAVRYLGLVTGASALDRYTAPCENFVPVVGLFVCQRPNAAAVERAV